MTSGTTLRRVATLAVLLLPIQVCFGALDAQGLLARLARPAPATTPFVEVRFSRLLDQPLVSSGQLEYLGGDNLARTVATPFQERTEIRGESVNVEREGQRPRRFSLKRAPELRSMIAGFAAVLGGSRTALERDFELAVLGEENNWRLVLTPRDARIARYVRDIVINGSDAEPRCLVVTEPDADMSVMLVAAAAEVTLPTPLERTWLDHFCESAGS